MTYAIVFIVYILAMLAIGLFFANKNENMSDYILGGRSLNVWVASLSAQASDMSGWLLTGLPGLAYLSANGSQEAIWTAIGLAVGTYLNWLVVAKDLDSIQKYQVMLLQCRIILNTDLKIHLEY